MNEYKIRWEDLASPRTLISDQFAAAMDTVPTLIVVALCFFAGIISLYVSKKLTVWMLMKCARQPYTLQKWVAKKVQTTGPVKNITWATAPTHHFFNYVHIFIESLFFLGVIITAVLAFSFGGVNIWQNPVAVSVIILVVTYVFATGLQQLGSGYFFFLNNCMTPGEWWEQVGGGISGRVCNITPFFIEFESKDLEHGGLILQRASMSTAFMSNWQRNYYKESEEPHLSKETVQRGPPTAVPASNRVKDM